MASSTITIDLEIEAHLHRRSLKKIATLTDREIAAVARFLAVEGRERARDIATAQIYATPQRGDYKRTYTLLRSIYGEVRKVGFSHIIIVGAAADYAIFNELGTYDNTFPGIQDQIALDAFDTGSARPLLTYPKNGRGLEPRPFIIPAVVALYNNLVSLLDQAYARVSRGVQ
jgi:hypothetical protein